MIIVRCPGCGRIWELDEAAADRRLRCRACSLLFKVPQLSQVPRVLKVIETPEGKVYIDEHGITYS